MRIYSRSDEENIRTERLVREWTRSGLLDPAQCERLQRDLKSGLRRTNKFLRLVMLAFGVLIVGALFMLTVIESPFGSDAGLVFSGLFGAAICFGLAEILVRYRRLYRFGIEEAFAVSSAALFGIGAGNLISPELFVGLAGAAAVAFVVYLRFGYVYSAVIAIACLAFSILQIGLSAMWERILIVAILLAIFVIVRSKRQQYGDEFPGDEYGIIQAFTWAGIYVAINLHLFDRYLGASFPPFFYWSTYLLTAALPAIGLYLALSHKERLLLDVSLVMALVTLVTNKPYLGLPRQTWDPILFGLLLAGAAIMLRRWLAAGRDGQRYGFTAARLLHSDKKSLSLASAASVGVQADLPTPTPSESGFKPGGGRSGGAGASGTF